MYDVGSTEFPHLAPPRGWSSGAGNVPLNPGSRRVRGRVSELSQAHRLGSLPFLLSPAQPEQGR